MVHPDAQGRAVGAADGEQFREARLEPAEFLGILLVGVFQVLELAGRVHVVAGVDAHLLHHGRRHVGHGRVEVDVGHEGAVVARLAQGFADGAQGFGLAGALCGEPHVVGARVEYGAALRHGGFDVGRRRRRHALQAQGLFAAEATVAHADAVGAARVVVEEVHGQFVLKRNFTSARSALAFTIFSLSPSL